MEPKPGKRLTNLPALAAVLLSQACLPGMQKMSARKLYDLDRKQEGPAIYGPFTGSSSPQPPPDIYVKKPRLELRPRGPQQAAGSLFNLDDERNQLFTTMLQPKIGSFVTVAIDGNGPQKTADGSDKGPGNAKRTAGGSEENPDDKPKLEEELLAKALPSLAPAEGFPRRVIQQFKMKLVHRYSNGDFLAVYERQSLSDEEGHGLSLQARLPYASLSQGEPMGSSHLLEVKLTESRDGEIIEKQSSGWEDEYTMRLSGFTEAKSRLAMELDEKRRDLEKARQKMEDRLHAVGQERRRMAKDRDQLLMEKREGDKKVEGLNQTIADQQKQIEDQNKIISDQQQKLSDLEKPQEKAGDDRDGAEGK